MTRNLSALFVVLALTLASPGSADAASNPIMFVTQVPLTDDFATVNAVFGNHTAGTREATRGGDLWIRYPDGTLKNLTAAAGYGNVGFQGAQAISVRDPAVHWDGQKAVFSMVIGAPTAQFEVLDFRWQLYEVSGLGPGDTPLITKVPNQPVQYNNVMPVYGSDDRIIFVSDRPRSGEPHLYPQLDEYELHPTNTGLWSLDPSNGSLFLLDHAPSGDFDPIVDSFGRVIFTRWDHLQRDQEADDDDHPACGSPGTTYGTFNYSNESAAATAQLGNRTEVFPEPRSCREDLLASTNLVGHEFNKFFPWEVSQDGRGLETLNHVGRHELVAYIPATFNDDPDIVNFEENFPRANTNPVAYTTHHFQESPVIPGTFYATHSGEFSTHASGQVIAVKKGGAGDNADDMTVTYVTHPETAQPTDSPSPNHSGLYRDPLPLADGSVIAVHTSETRVDGSTGAPQSLYDFRLKTLVDLANGYKGPGQLLTSGIAKSVSYWNPDFLVTYSGILWELSPVELRPRPRPPKPTPNLPPPEQAVFADAGVSVEAFRQYLIQNDLAVVVSRNVTTRDHADHQQPFNLRVPGGSAETIAASGRVYDIAHIQFFQGDQIRGYTGDIANTTPVPGRRVLAQPLHDAKASLVNPPDPAGPVGAVALGPDGSMAAFVPARRAMTWQLIDPAATPVVRERYWLSFQPGEIRSCTSCHGINKNDQANDPTPINKPAALKTLLDNWKAVTGGGPNCFALTATPSPANGGTVNVVPPPNCGGAYSEATVVTLTAQPAAGFSFTNWTGDLTGGAASQQLTMNAAKTVVAAFAAQGGAVLNGLLPGPLPLLPPDNWWNVDLSQAPVDPKSAAFIAFINAQGVRKLHPDFGGDVSPGSADNYGMSYIVVGGSQPKRTVEFQYADESDGVDHGTGQSFPFYPIPDQAITLAHWVEGGQPGNIDLRSDQDRHILIVDRDNRTLYELWNCFFDGQKWNAGSGAFFDLKTNARRPDVWTSADAAGLAILPGLVRYDEVDGPDEIRHALRVTLRTSCGMVFPASHQTGCGSADALPMGARLRLKASTNLAGFPPSAQKIFRAMKTYGLIMADNGSDMFVSGTYAPGWDMDVLNPAFSGLSASDFEVVQLGWQPPPPQTPTIHLDSPNGGEAWTVNSSHQVTWTSSQLDPAAVIRILYRDGGNWTLAGTAPVNAPSFSWTMPQTPIAATRVMVGSWLTDHYETSDESDQVFAIVAHLEFTLSIVKAGLGTGTVTSAPAGISCGADCAESYPSGTGITLTATAAAGSVFVGWSGNADCADGVVTADADKSCTATFDRVVLSGTLKATPMKAKLGRIIVVQMKVKNLTTTTLVTPSILTTTGSAKLQLVTSPAPATVKPARTKTFKWTYRATGTGTAQLSGSASSPLGRSNPIVSNVVTITP